MLSSRAEDSFSLAVLEYPAIIDLLRRFLSGPISAPLLASIKPSTNLSVVRQQLELAREAGESLNLTPRPSLAALADPRPVLEKIRIEGVSCSAVEIYSLLEIARAACDWRGLFQKTPFAGLNELAQSMADLGSLVRELAGKILPDGSVDSSASRELARIRRSIERTQQELQIALDRVLHKLGSGGTLQEEIVTVRNGRFVLPVRTEKKRAVEGIIHGASSSGASVYIEPLETLPLNNELVELQDREAAEITRILAELSGVVRASRVELLNAAEILSQLDLAFAKAEFARQYGGCIAEFSDTRELVLKEVRHPLLEKALAAEGVQAVPLSLELHPPQSLLIISGPNTGGKTVALKTIGTAALMAQAGMPVLAREARLPVFTRVLADIGDQQSIEQSLSTFSAHIRNIERMVEMAGANDMVLLDEIGGSTDPQEGAALAVAILEYFRKQKTMTFVTTHHSRLKAYAADTAEAVNAAMDFDEATLRPTYKVVLGLPGKSSGLDIAMRLGMEPAIIEHARSLMNATDAEAASLVASLHAQKSLLEDETERVRTRAHALELETAELRRKMAEELQARLKELDKRLEQVLHEYDKKWATALEDVRRQGQARALAKSVNKGKKLEREAREEWNAQVLETRESPSGSEQPEIAAKPAPGDRVRVKEFSAPGTVLAVMDGQVEVEVGRVHMRVPESSVHVIGGRRPQAELTMYRPPRRDATPAEEPSGLASAAEINVIGQAAEEAREQVDKFLDSAFMSGRFTVRVVHGTGKGILRSALHEMFASHPHVEKFYSAVQHEGGQGATIVELRR